MAKRTVLAVAVGGLSTAVGLLSLVALRWIGFLGLPPVVFLTLLLVGMPVGGVLLVHVTRLRRASLASVSLLSAGLALLAAGSFLCVTRFTQASVDMAGAEISTLALNASIRFFAAALAFFPLFVGQGLVEFAAYRAWLSEAGGKSRTVYALNLLGLLVAFVCYRLLLVAIGTSGLLAAGLALLFVSAFALKPQRWITLVVAAVCVVPASLPGAEDTIVRLLEVKSGSSTLNAWRKPPNKLIFDEWTPHCRLSIVDQGWGITGFYDGLFYWFFPREMPTPRESPGTYRRLDLVFANLVKPGDSVAILGAGGGVQVAAALRAGASRVVAVEVVPEVLEVLSGELSTRIEDVYRDPRVELVGRNARVFLRACRHEFDFIVLASVESNLGGLRDLFEPSQVMFTREALSDMQACLEEGGLLAISKHTSVDRRGVIFGQTYNGLQNMGMEVRGYVKPPSPSSSAPVGYRGLMADAVHYLIVAGEGPIAISRMATLDNIYRPTRTKLITKPPPASGRWEITDDRAFATGLLIANLGLYPLSAGIAGMALVLLLVGIGLVFWLGRATGHAETRSGLRCVSLASVAVGFNFMTLEYLVVYRLLDRVDIPMDATYLGMIVFAGLAAAGSALLGRHTSRLLVAISALLAVGLAVTAFFAPGASLVLGCGASFLTGSLFPRLLRGQDERLVRVYVWDAYGSLWGGLCALFIPLFGGFSGHQTLAALGIFLTTWAVSRTTVSPNEDTPS